MNEENEDLKELFLDVLKKIKFMCDYDIPNFPRKRCSDLIIETAEKLKVCIHKIS